MEKLIENSEKNLRKAIGDVTLGIDRGANLGITLMYPAGFKTMHLDEAEINQLGFWLNKNYDLSMCPGFKEALEYRAKEADCERYKRMNEDAVERMAELGSLIKRQANVIKGVLDVNEIKGGLCPEAIKQMKDVIAESEKE